MHCQEVFFLMFFENPVPLNIRLRMQPRFVTVDKMTGTFTKRICQPYRGHQNVFLSPFHILHSYKKWRS